MNPSLDVVIVNWNAGAQLRACLESLSTTARDGLRLHRVVVVDNASRDGSADGLDGLDLPLVVIRNPANRGFGAACNQGARGSEADYLLFLNPDVLLYPDALVRPLRFLDDPAQARVGICGVQLVDERGEVSRTCARFPTLGIFAAKMLGLDRCLPRRFPSQAMSEWDHRETRQVDQVMGAFFLVRRSLFEALGGFDESFFVYFEEVDFSFRASAAGWSSWYLAETRAFHQGRGTSDQVKATRLFYSLRSRIRYGRKHFRRPAAVALTMATLLVEPLSRLALAAGRRSRSEAAETLAGYSRLWAALPRLLADRDLGRP